MTETADHHPLLTRVHLGAGTRPEDLAVVEEALGDLFDRLAAWPVGSVDLWLRVRDRGGARSRSTLELQVPDLPLLAASSAERDPVGALSRVGAALADQLSQALARRAHSRGSTTSGHRRVLRRHGPPPVAAPR